MARYMSAAQLRSKVGAGITLREPYNMGLCRRRNGLQGLNSRMAEKRAQALAQRGPGEAYWT